MERNLTFGKTQIRYNLTRKQQKLLKITVHPNELIEVVAPLDKSEDDIQLKVRKKAPWILEKLAKIREQCPEEPKELLNGEKLLYLGRRYKLKLKKVDSPKFEAGHYLLPKTHTRDHAMADYKQRAHGIIKERLKQISLTTGVEPKGFKIVEQKARWGSCDKNGLLRINWKIIMAPKRIIDYVLCHELAHLKVKDHSSKFWRSVEEMLPDYEERREWLRLNGPTLTF
jgi:predicted metal-dependent hydrolase